jgi:hypothetical protein
MSFLSEIGSSSSINFFSLWIPECSGGALHSKVATLQLATVPPSSYALVRGQERGSEDKKPKQYLTANVSWWMR